MRDAMKRKPEWRGKCSELNLRSIVWANDHPRVPQLSLLCGLLLPTPSSHSPSPSHSAQPTPPRSPISHRRTAAEVLHVRVRCLGTGRKGNAAGVPRHGFI